MLMFPFSTWDVSDLDLWGLCLLRGNFALAVFIFSIKPMQVSNVKIVFIVVFLKYNLTSFP